MAKYSSTQKQNSALRTLEEFDTERVRMAMRIDDPLEGYKFGLDASNISQNITYVGKSMVVDGNITSSDAVAVKGTVKGDVKTTSDMGISGLVSGNLSADSISFDHAAVKGNATAQKDINVSDDSVIIGDIEAGTIIVDGKVKGNVTAQQKVMFHNTSLVVGTVKAANFNMEDGARLNGNIIITSKNINVIDDSEFDLEV